MDKMISYGVFKAQASGGSLAAESILWPYLGCCFRGELKVAIGFRGAVDGRIDCDAA